MQKKILSLSEINEIEKTYKHGFPSLGFAAEELLHRWQNDLRDEETCIRLIFLRWYSCSEPSNLTGLENEMPTIETIITEFGGEGVLSSETLFILGILGHDTFAFCFGEESIWKNKSIEFLERATELQPTSQLFADWNYFIGKSANSKNLKTTIITEIHARFYGRGVLGDYLEHILTFIIKSK